MNSELSNTCPQKSNKHAMKSYLLVSLFHFYGKTFIGMFRVYLRQQGFLESNAARFCRSNYCVHHTILMITETYKDFDANLPRKAFI